MTVKLVVIVVINAKAASKIDNKWMVNQVFYRVLEVCTYRAY